MAGAATGRARLVELERQVPADPGEGFLESELDGRLHVAAPVGADASAEVAEVHELCFAKTTTGAPAPPTPNVSEDRAEKVGEALPTAFEADFAASEGRAVGRPAAPGARLGVAMPVGSECVVALALLRVAEDFVGAGGRRS